MPVKITKWWCEEIYSQNQQKGFWPDDEPLTTAPLTKLTLIASEVFEAIASVRKGKSKSEKIPDFYALEEELVDVVIRVMDLAGALDLDLEGAIVAKLEYNKTRPMKHGKLF